MALRVPQPVAATQPARETPRGEQVKVVQGPDITPLVDQLVRSMHAAALANREVINTLNETLSGKRIYVASVVRGADNLITEIRLTEE